MALDNQGKNLTDEDPVQGKMSEDGIECPRKRAFIKRLAKAGAIAPAVILLHDASSNGMAFAS